MYEFIGPCTISVEVVAGIGSLMAYRSKMEYESARSPIEE